MSNELLREIAVVRCELRAARDELHELRELVLSRLGPQTPAEHPDDLVGTEFVCRLFRCSIHSVYQGKAGTKEIVWVRRRPKAARRGQVMQVYREFVGRKQAPTQRALKLVRRKRRGSRAA